MEADEVAYLAYVASQERCYSQLRPVITFLDALSIVSCTATVAVRLARPRLRHFPESVITVTTCVCVCVCATLI